ncbi:DUF6037 family protein [Citricoccus sp. NR2]|uniref:DUF6037 family protein n=1 Tax=Citricoccus sp. NR2 TaxID=3004095 RepID=UPI0022DE8828|nr:DUF6037 family protein [Citricoccus sp. NR2]WBL20119.1 DUF6037 family protein [Citricoccus sp. NR2]
MVAPLKDLRALRDELIAREWVITCFEFKYKKHTYFVLVERYVPKERAPAYALVQMTFIDSMDRNRILATSANSVRIRASATEIREYFGIDWAPNLREFIDQFHEHLGLFVPSQIPQRISPQEQSVVLRQLDQRADENEGKVHCFGVRRNPNRADGSLGQRSLFNSQKTEMLRPELYARLKNDKNISFLYSVNPADGQSDAEILSRFSGM